MLTRESLLRAGFGSGKTSSSDTEKPYETALEIAGFIGFKVCEPEPETVEPEPETVDSEPVITRNNFV